MRELDLLDQYLIRLRQEKLQQAHATLIADLNDSALRAARCLAFEAELVERIRGATKALADDAGAFIKEYLS